MKHVFQMLWITLRGGKKVICALAIEKPEGLVFIRDLVEAGAFKSVIDRSYLLDQMAEAHRYYENGHRQRQVVVHLN